MAGWLGMTGRQLHRRARAIAAGMLMLQAGGCTIDPDLPFQAAFQFATETAIFFLDSWIVSLR